jgi:hypothetical protein
MVENHDVYIAGEAADSDRSFIAIERQLGSVPCSMLYLDLSETTHMSFRLTFLLCILCLRANAGYTHYYTWHQAPEAVSLRECIGEMRLLVEARKTMLAGPEGDQAPLIESERLIFNGIGDDSHEPFVFPGTIVRTPPVPQLLPGFNICKTVGKPYDEVVTACLMVARDHFPVSVLAIGSDGSWFGGDWRQGASLYSSVLRRPAKNPIEGQVVLGEPVPAPERGGVLPRTLTFAVLGVAALFYLAIKAWG